MSRRTLTPEQQAKTAERKARFAVIVQQIADMPEAERDALAARMMVTNCDGHTLSPRNQMLIAMQLGTHCTIVGGFKQWLKQGRCVKKGEQGATILFPRTFGDKNGPENATAASEQAATAESNNGKKSPVRFLSGTVFDISQTALINGDTWDPERDEAKARQIHQDAAARVAQPGYDPEHAHHSAMANNVGKITKTIWDENPNNEPALICPPPPKREKPSLMNQPPPGGWTEADKVPAHQRKGPTPQVEALPGMTPLGKRSEPLALPPNPALQPASDVIEAQWELL